MAERTPNEDEAELALAQDRRQKRLDHSRPVHPPAIDCRIAAGEIVLPLRARADLALCHHPLAAEMVEGGVDVAGSRNVGPQRRDRHCAARREFGKIAFVGVPAHHFAGIADRDSRRFQRFQPLQKRVLGRSIVPGGANQRNIAGGQFGQRRAPVQVDHFGPARQSLAQCGDLVVMLKGVKAPGR